MRGHTTPIAAVSLLILISMSLQAAGAVNESMNPAGSSLEAPTNTTELVAFVEAAVAHAKEVGEVVSKFKFSSKL